MKKSFLDYYKEILEKVSFDQYLFNKEFYKAVKSVESDEIQKLMEWIEERGLHSNLIP